MSSGSTTAAAVVFLEAPLFINSFGFAKQTVFIRSEHTNHVSQDHININAQWFVRNLGHKRLRQCAYRNITMARSLLYTS